MTTLPDRPNSALLVIDVQRGVIDHAFGRDGVVNNIATLVLRARDEGTDVIWVQHEGPEMQAKSSAWMLVPELRIEAGEALVAKSYPDSFEATDLEVILTAGRIGHLIIVGAQTDECVRSTLHGAVTRGYDTTLVSDAHTTEDLSEWGAPTPEAVIAHTNLYWGNHAAPGRSTEVVCSDEVTFVGSDTPA